MGIIVQLDQARRARRGATLFEMLDRMVEDARDLVRLHDTKEVMCLYGTKVLLVDDLKKEIDDVQEMDPRKFVKIELYLTSFVGRLYRGCSPAFDPKKQKTLVDKFRPHFFAFVRKTLAH